ncbi:TlpA family protein disulfide reductase [Pedobacter sp. ISL-68]|uniref:TlpA family protein disulfide reductase n=1 Tax=unclassified Pedobacter TaxID=2628915 RepID=UPI001BE699F1|nr:MULTISPECIES: TlpA disulfide reductase family protein [unclassified Pedobacter]MBT2561315.1 TlpA family protein disulfide reductase [Pedobacter sp. ISL-64]MBT2590704.1 TlpA family protein disulfide reductase [Pedobacter sp. ISL-68]
MKNLIYAIMFFAFTQSYAQNTNEFPTVGKPMPDFHLNDVKYYPRKKVSLNDFKGQWLILDFWNQYCGVCLSSQPRINNLQKKFKGKVQFLLVGYTGSQYIKVSNDTSIRRLYERQRLREKLSLAIAYDSTLMHRYNIRATPYLIIIDPRGIVQGITTVVTEENINDLMAGRRVTLPQAYLRGERQKALTARPDKMN